MMHLVLGGARSGKSGFAETLAANQPEDQNNTVVYVATATIGDEEMRKRIAHHKSSRPQEWLLIEEPFNLAKVIKQYSQSSEVLIIECMTLWLTNWLCTNDEAAWHVEREEFIEAIVQSNNRIIIVSNEVGSGIVPMGELNRDFVDQSGWLNQTLAKVANKVTLVVAGCPIAIKPPIVQTDF